MRGLSRGFLRLSGESRNPLVYRGWPSEPSPQENVIAQWVPASAGMTVGVITSFRPFRGKGIHSPLISILRLLISELAASSVPCMTDADFSTGPILSTLSTSVGAQDERMCFLSE